MVAATAFILLIVGCSSATNAPSAAIDPFFSDLLAEAHSKGASETQIAILEEAAAAGDITYEQAETQLAEYFTCLEESGLEPMRQPDREDPPGYRIPSFTVGLGDDDSYLETALALLDACYTEHYEFVDMAIQLQPSAIEAENADIESHRAEILDCISDTGGAIDQDSTTDELVDAILEVGDRTGVWCYEFS